MDSVKTKKKQPVLPGPRLADAEIGDFIRRGKDALFLPADIASVVVFRVAFGLILLWEVFRYFDNGYIETYWVKPDFLFTYWPFDFVKPLNGEGMFLLYYVLGLLACCITLGLYYRIATIGFFLGMSYSFLLDQTRYLNHAYLICLISFVLIFLPANRAYALDTKIFKGLKASVIPAWPIWLVRFMVGIPYFFGGIAKINADWLRGEPLRTWLAYDTDFPIIGPYFTEEWMIYVMSYSGLLFDLLIVPGLLFRRTRPWAFLFMLLFNLVNARLFEIGIFPWFMIFASLIFFPPSWPRQLLKAWNPSREEKPLTIPDDWSTAISPRRRALVTGALGIWALIHILLPLRHLAIPGNVHWTEEGHKYAWHMKLRTKRSQAAIFVIDKRTKELIPIDLREYLTSAQIRKMPGQPDMLWQFCRMLRAEFAKSGKDVAVHADVKVTLNGRSYQPIVSPELDISSLPRPGLGHTGWVLPLTTPLSSRLAEVDDGEVE